MNLMQILTNENPIMIYIVKIFYVVIESYLYYRIISTALKLNKTRRQKCEFIFALSTCSVLVLFMPSSILTDILNVGLFALILHFILKLHFLSH